MKNRFLIASLLVLMPLCGAAQTLSLEECLSLARENNKQILSRSAQSEQAAFAVKAQKALFLPEISASGNGYWNNKKGLLLSIPQVYLPGVDPATGSPLPDVPSAWFPGADIDYEIGMVLGGGVSITQPIFMGGKITAAYKMAKISEKMSQAQETQTRQEVSLDVTRAFTDLVRAQQMLEVARQYHSLLEELFRQVQSAVSNGLKMQSDALKVQVRLNESELSLRRAENARRLAAKNLCRVIGRPFDAQIEVETELPEILFPDPSAADISLRPEYGMLDDRIALAKEQVTLQRAELMPQVGVQGNYNYMHGLKVGGETVLNGGSFSVALKVSIPIFHFGARSSKVRAAKAGLRQAELEREHLVEKMQLELSRAWDLLDEARLEEELSLQSLEQADENRTLCRKQYKAGMESLSDYLEAELLWRQAFASQVESRCQTYLAYVQFLKVSGQME